MTHKPPHGSGAKGPDELRQQIEQTRHQLGDTVSQLVDRVDVKGRARARAADLKDKAGAMTVQLRTSAAHAGHTVQHRAIPRRGGSTAPVAVPQVVRGDARRRPSPALLVGVLGAAALSAGIVWLRQHRH
ncbi:DUF3618 domain-containing protein [Streptomyces sp. LP11]|uniref:DUF3618 domain-containing protein n=1 Tax=Streptomyces pyxinicus TaxID=2970331 RepID=A0ABT2B416_9ACTN|nr:DUF3618 domain-containing protein [Streptomyces sp. LP11]MCS0603251.1 DUF3618 domain-containing protein [Streptomyces sp. LP11]